MNITCKKFAKGSVVVEEMPGGNAHVTLSHGSYVFNPEGGLIIEHADVQDLADCLASFAKSVGTIFIVPGVRAEWIEIPLNSEPLNADKSAK